MCAFFITFSHFVSSSPSGEEQCISGQYILTEHTFLRIFIVAALMRNDLFLEGDFMTQWLYIKEPSGRESISVCLALILSNLMNNPYSYPMWTESTFLLNSKEYLCKSAATTSLNSDYKMYV